VHASSKKFDGPARMSYAKPQLPTGGFLCVECMKKAAQHGAIAALR
jgi:uncharacterized protein (DUF2345 family)